MDRYLIVVARERAELWQELSQRHVGAAEVEVILDRRERRGAWGVAERRAPLREDTDLARQAFVVVPRN